MKKYRGLAISLAVVAVLSAFIPALLVIAILLSVLAMLFLVRNLEFGLILLVFFFPYLGLVIDFGQFEIFRNVPQIRSINAPFIDLYGLLLFVAWGIHLLFGRKQFGGAGAVFRPFRAFKVFAHDIHLKAYFFFWLSGLITLFKVPAVQFGVSLKYFARPFTFFYPVFFVVPVSILTRDSESTRLRDSEYSQTRKLANSQTLLHRVLMVFFWTGLLAAADGFLGLLFGAHDSFPRAMPLGFFGVNPLGPNHNLLAETLIATAPVGLMLSWIYGGRASGGPEARPRPIATWIRYGMFFQWGIALLTFARTAWIAIGMQAALFLWLTHRGRVKNFLKRSAPILIILAVLAGFLLATIFTETVRGSTLSRLEMARIAGFYFERSPVLGEGIGTFIPTLWQTKAFLLEYGDPLEAHGIIFKLMFEQGLFGLITFGIFAGSILFSLYRAHGNYRGDDARKIALVAALLIAAGSFTYQLFNTTYYTSKLWVPLAIAVAISRIMNQESRIMGQVQKPKIHDS